MPSNYTAPSDYDYWGYDPDWDDLDEYEPKEKPMDRDLLAEAFQMADAPDSTMILPERAHVVALVEYIRLLERGVRCLERRLLHGDPLPTETASHLRVALAQVVPSDDQIIVGHIKAALELLGDPLPIEEESDLERDRRLR